MEAQRTTDQVNAAADYLAAHGPAALAQAVKEGKIRSLSREHVVKRMQLAQAQEMASASEYDVVTLAVHQKDKETGKVKLDAEGFPLLVDKRVRKRDLIKRRWELKIQRVLA
jgi:hypothetical protein